MVAINSLKSFAITIFKGVKQKQIVESVAKVGEKPLLKTVADEPGLRILERVWGDNLFRYETRVINGKPTSTIQVFNGKGEYIGKGGDQGLKINRTKNIQVEDSGSIFSGKKIIINKNYNETMGMTEHQEILAKEYTPEGIYEHGEQTLKYRHWDKPKTKVYDRITYANGQTPYTEALEAKKTAEKIRLAEEKALAEDALRAEQEAAKKIAAETPRVNIGKVFGKNLDELKKMQDEVLADGTIVRKYVTKDKNGFSQYIVTKDKGSYHEESIIDTAKNMKILYTQIGEAEPKITMSKGLQYRQKSESLTDSYGRNYRNNTQVYNNGRDYVEFDDAGNPGRFNLHTSEGDIAGYNKVRDVFAYVASANYTPVSREAVTNLKAIQKEAKSEYIDLLDLFKPYSA